MVRKPNNAKRIRLGDRDYEIFEHVARYRLTTREVLQRLFFPDSELNAVTKVTSRLCDHEYLVRHELTPPRCYFTPGRAVARLLGISQKCARPLGPQALFREYATLAFCCLSAEHRQRLTVRDMSKRFAPLLEGGGDSSHFYLDNDGEVTSLAYIRVDGGGTADHVVRKCRQDVDSRYVRPAWRQLIDGGRFMLAIVTASEPKADEIKRSLSKQVWPVRFRMEVIPDLMQLMGELRSA